MKTDRELLELAARAAGHYVALCCDGKYWKTETPDSDGIEHWNSLESDGDALRLAVKRKMLVDVTSFSTTVIANGDVHEVEKHNGDPYAATRRAIVRAAAAIGEGVTQEIGRAEIEKAKRP